MPDIGERCSLAKSYQILSPSASISNEESLKRPAESNFVDFSKNFRYY
jgi:hypothetical protein